MQNVESVLCEPHSISGRLTDSISLEMNLKAARPFLWLQFYYVNHTDGM